MLPFGFIFPAGSGRAFWHLPSPCRRSSGRTHALPSHGQEEKTTISNSDEMVGESLNNQKNIPSVHPWTHCRLKVLKSHQASGSSFVLQI